MVLYLAGSLRTAGICPGRNILYGNCPGFVCRWPYSQQGVW